MGPIENTDLSVRSEDALAKQTDFPQDEDMGFDPRDCYMLVYKKQGSIETRHFHFIPKDPTVKHFKAAIQRAQDFCQRMDFRFIHCAPFIIDLDELESKRTEY